MSDTSPPVFFLPPDLWREPFELAGPEAVHATKALRLGVGDDLSLIDGQGRLGLFRIERAAKNRLALSLIRQTLSVRPEARLHLAPGFSKSGRRGFLIEKAAELGAAGLVFWRAARSQGEIPKAPKETWLAQAAAGAKQSRNPFIPQLSVAASLAALIERAARFDQRLVAVEPSFAAAPLAPDAMRRPGDAILVLGPEGGLTDPEAAGLTLAGFTPVSLGPNTLRLETAALAALALWHWAR